MLVDDQDAGLLEDLDAALDTELPPEVDGWPTRFPTSWDGRARHKVDLNTVHEFVASRLGFDLRSPLAPTEWLCLTGQSVLEVTAGPVFHDTTTEYSDVRAALEWYPADVWRYVLAAGWARLGQELPLIGRTGELGDEVGSCVIAGRLCRDLTHLAFTVERSWMPYSKWSGTMLNRLPGGRSIVQALEAVLKAHDWEERQRSTANAIELVAERHRAVGLDVPSTVVVSFFDRPFIQPNGEIQASLLAGIVDREVCELPLIGAIEQWCDNVDLLSFPQRRARTATILKVRAGGGSGDVQQKLGRSVRHRVSQSEPGSSRVSATMALVKPSSAARSPGEVLRAMVAAFDTGHVDDLADFVHGDYVDHQGLPHTRPIKGVDGFRHVVEAARSGYTDLSVEVADLIEGDDRSAARLTWAGIRPSGEQVRRETLEIVRVESGRAIEHWGGHS